MPCQIACISWEAAATIFTGLLAVGGATTVGALQLKILNEQKNISLELKNLETLKAKSDLFDKRLKVYIHTRDWLEEFLKNGARPENEIASNFAQSLEEAEFLFGSEMFKKLNGWRMLANKHFYHNTVFNTPAANPNIDHVTAMNEIAIELLSAREKLRATFKAAVDLSAL